MRKTKFALVMTAMALTSAQALANDCIIDSNLMNKGVWAEPIFNAPVAASHSSRGPASVSNEAATSEAAPAAAKIDRNPAQYLDVQKVIPFSEPSVSKASVERDVLGDN